MTSGSHASVAGPTEREPSCPRGRFTLVNVVRDTSNGFGSGGPTLILPGYPGAGNHLVSAGHRGRLQVDRSLDARQREGDE